MIRRSFLALTCVCWGSCIFARTLQDPDIDAAEKLFSLKVLDRLGEQKLPLREDYYQEFIFCQAIREANVVLSCRRLLSGFGIDRSGEILDVAMRVIPYALGDGSAKELNESREH